MEPRDYPRVLRLCQAQNRRDGTSYPVPPVFDMDPGSPRFGQYLPNIVLAVVVEAAGRVRQAHVFLRTIEEMTFGGGAEDMAFSAQHIEVTLDLLRRRGYDDFHTFLPHNRVSDLGPTLAEHGLNRLDLRLAHFFRML
jgi:hypothetical protein